MCFKQASKYPKWQEAMIEEYNALLANETCELVPFHFGQNLVGCKWIFRVKFNSDGYVERYKARLVALGNHQQARIDCHETFSPVVKPPTISLILLLAVILEWPT